MTAADPLPSWPSRLALWAYDSVRRRGVLSVPVVDRAYTTVYALYKRHLDDPFDNLRRVHPELFAGGHVIDVGANIGYTAGVFARAIDPGFRVWAFEPASENVARLHAMVEQSGFQSVVVVKRAVVADRAGSTDLVLNPRHPGDHRVTAADADERGRAVERVPVTTLDEEAEREGITPIAFVKIDVQGYEFHVCRGMRAVLDANPRAAIAVEYAPAMLRAYGVQDADFAAFFAERGYRPYRVTQRGALLPLAIKALGTDLPSCGYIDILFTRTAPVAGHA
ncbi:MAG: hypothetical protein JWL71_543 [Acidobacteria bacterium]|nr:hypothetical protein [Acidobacteriota bacterium]